MSENLKPCPFCGCSKIKVDSWATWYAKCTDCGVETGGFTRPEAVSHWNTRAPQAGEPKPVAWAAWKPPSAPTGEPRDAPLGRSATSA